MYFYRESLSVSKKFVQDNRGSVTIEFVIWLPFIGALLTFFAEVAFLFTVNAAMWSTTHDITRRLAHHQIQSSDADADFREQSFFASRDYRIDVEEDSEMVTVTVRLRVSDATLLGEIGRWISGDLSSRVSMFREPVS